MSKTLVILLLQITPFLTSITEKRKLHHMDSSIMLKKTLDHIETLKKNIFNHSETVDILLKIYAKKNLKDFAEIQKLIEEKKPLTHNQDHFLFMIHKIEDFLKKLKKKEFGKDDVLEIIEKNLFLEFIQEKLDDRTEEDYIVHPKDREYLNKLPNTIYDYHDDDADL